VFDGSDHVLTWANLVFRQWCRGRTVLGERAEDVLRGVVDVDRFGRLLDEVLATGEAYQTGQDVRAWSGQGEVHYELSFSVLPGAPDDSAVLVVANDITDHEVARRQQAVRAAREQTLLRLVNASTRMSGTEDKLAALAGAAVPALADVCGVYLLDRPLPAGAPPTAPIASWRIAAPTSPGVTGPVPQSRSVWIGDDPVSAAVAAGGPVVVHYGFTEPPAWAEAAGVAAAIGPGRVHSTAIVPVLTDDHVRAVIAFGAGPDRPAYGDSDLELFGLIGAQAEVAIQEGTRFDHLRATALALQRALLTDPPPVDGVEVRVRYRPAGVGAEVGGDWYDVFALPSADTAVVVGDVAGHDFNAAAVMGQLRSMLRGFAVHSGDAPAQVLTALDHVIKQMTLTRLATCVYARIGRPGPTGTPVTWSNAGNPSPVLLLPSGATQVLDRPHDPALGIPGNPTRTSGTLCLTPGSTLLLFSDGLFERRGHDVDDSFADLRARIGARSGAGLEELCDELLEHAPHDDDLVLVALRPR
jgi:serine phosphatase RsbU (regulator of sigma subunit)